MAIAFFRCNHSKLEIELSIAIALPIAEEQLNISSLAGFLSDRNRWVEKAIAFPYFYRLTLFRSLLSLDEMLCVQKFHCYKNPSYWGIEGFSFALILQEEKNCSAIAYNLAIFNPIQDISW